jgi:hypothetical protein
MLKASPRWGLVCETQPPHEDNSLTRGRLALRCSIHGHFVVRRQLPHPDWRCGRPIPRRHALTLIVRRRSAAFADELRRDRLLCLHALSSFQRTDGNARTVARRSVHDAPPLLIVSATATLMSLIGDPADRV